jgi:DNA uptake protein ComE-like DNA-binding protein
MRSLIKFSLIGIGAATAALAVRSLFRRRPQPFVRTTQDLSYSAISPSTLAENNLIDLNTGAAADFLQLGLSDEVFGRIVENRPFRNKLELLSRRVITEEIYETVKDRIGVANANEAIKIA